MGHAKLVGVHRHAGDPLHTEVEGGDGVPQLASEGQHEAPQAGVHMQQQVVAPGHLHCDKHDMGYWISCQAWLSVEVRMLSRNTRPTLC